MIWIFSLKFLLKWRMLRFGDSLLDVAGRVAGCKSVIMELLCRSQFEIVYFCFRIFKLESRVAES